MFRCTFRERLLRRQLDYRKFDLWEALKFQCFEAEVYEYLIAVEVKFTVTVQMPAGLANSGPSENKGPPELLPLQLARRENPKRDP